VDSQNVLVTSAGSIVAQGIMKCLNLANQQAGTDGRYKIVAADMSPRAPGLYRADFGALVPPVTSPDYLDFIIKLCLEKKIRAVFVGSDEETFPLALAKDDIENKSGAVVITNPPDVISIATDKWETFRFLKQRKLPCAESALPKDRVKFVRRTGFPVVVKPREGHGSLHFYVAHDEDELEASISIISKAGWRPFLQEYLDGEDSEFTSGVTISTSGKIMSSISMRKFLKGGQTYKAFIDDYAEVRKVAEETALQIGARGPINIQGKMSGGTIKTFEINPRFSATSPLRAVAGINEADIIFRNVVFREEPRKNKYERLVCMRYLNEVYIPYSTYEDTERNRSVQVSNSFIPNYF